MDAKDLQPGLASSHFFFRRRQVLPGTSQQHPAYPTRPVNIQPVLLRLCSSTLVLGLKLSVGTGLALIVGDDEGSAISG